ncbi:MAG: Ig-like domain-containing protein, partial [Acidimicrobiia bacterium]|nr:Ig-like domain-containing protein [Acidimicrobiia bacterium]
MGSTVVRRLGLLALFVLVVSACSDDVDDAGAGLGDLPASRSAAGAFRVEAVDDRVVFEGGDELVIDVVANDTVPFEGWTVDALEPSVGSLKGGEGTQQALADAGLVAFVPPPPHVDWSEATLEYRIHGGATIEAATVTIVNRPPLEARPDLVFVEPPPEPITVLDAVDDVVVVEDDRPIVIDVLANDAIPGGQSPRVEVRSPSVGSFGSHEWGFGQLRETGRIPFIAPDHPWTEATFEYTVDAGGQRDTARVTITQRPRLRANPDTVTIEYDGAVPIESRNVSEVVIRVLDNDVGADGHAFSSSNPASLTDPPDVGSVEWAGSFFSYRPPVDPDRPSTSFTYTIEDGSGSTAVGRVTIEFRDTSAGLIVEDDTFDVFQPGEVRLDPTVNDNGAARLLDVTAPDDLGVPVGEITVESHQVVYRPSDEIFELAPVSLRFAYTVEGLPDSEVPPVGAGLITVRVWPRTDLPPEPVMETGPAPVVIDVLANDRGPDRSSIVLGDFFDPPAGSFSREGDRFVYLPDFENRHDDVTTTFTYSIEDGTDAPPAFGRVTITFGDPGPVDAVDDAVEVVDGELVYINPLDNDTAAVRIVEVGPLDAVGLGVYDAFTGEQRFGEAFVQSRTQIAYRASPELLDRPATDVRFTYTVADDEGHLDTAVVTVRVRPDRFPKPVDDRATVLAGERVQIRALDNDGRDDLEIVGVGTPPEGQAGFTQEWIEYEAPANAQSGTVSIPYTVRVRDRYGFDDAEPKTATATVLVRIDRLPVAEPDEVQINAGEVVLVDVLANDSDPDGQTLVLEGVRTNEAPFTARIADDLRHVEIQASEFHGAYGQRHQLEYLVSDGGRRTGAVRAVTGSVAVTLNGVIAIDDRAVVKRGESVTVDVVANDTDPEGDAFTVTAVDAPATIAGPGAISYAAPAEGAPCSDHVVYTITDARGATSRTYVYVDVTDAVVAPTLRGGSVEVPVDAEYDVIGSYGATGGCGWDDAVHRITGG